MDWGRTSAETHAHDMADAHEMLRFQDARCWLALQSPAGVMSGKIYVCGGGGPSGWIARQQSRAELRMGWTTTCPKCGVLRPFLQQAGAKETDTRACNGARLGKLGI